MKQLLFYILAVLILARIIYRFGLGEKIRRHRTKPKDLATPAHKDIFTVLVFAKISVRRYFRDRLAIFFTVLFPLIFLLVFGSLSRGDGATFHIGLINQSTTTVANQFVQQIKANRAFKVDPTVNDLTSAKSKMGKSQIEASVILPPEYGAANSSGLPAGQVLVYYDQNNAQAAQTVSSIIQAGLDGLNTKLIKASPPFSVVTKSTNTSGLSALDYTVSGLIGFSIIGLGIFGPVNYFPEMKKQGVLRRLHITPLRVWQFFVSSVLSNAIIGLFSIAIMIAVAVGLFDFRIIGNYLELAVFLVVGILCIFGIGLAIGGWAKNERQAAPLANVVVFPMMFLSGTFFPRYLMPEWLQHVTNFLPLTPIIDGIRMIATEGKHLTALGPQFLMIAVWTIIIYAAAFRVFRWE